MFPTRKTFMPAMVLLLVQGACGDQTGIAAPWTEPSEGVASALVRVTGEGVPYYADLAHDLIPTDGEWVAIVFKRSPSCIPADFNLLDWLDFSLFAPDGPACPMVVQVTGLFSEGSPIPRQEHHTGTAVPVWLAPHDEVTSAIADGWLNIGELAALPGLIEGVATTFNQTIRNSDGATGGHGQRPGSSSTTAKGRLADGRSFTFHLVERFDDVTGRTLMHVETMLR